MKGQVQLMESTMILFVFFFLVVIGLVIYSNIQNDRLDSLQKSFDQERAVSLARTILNSPELNCMNNNVQVMNCFELQKMTALSFLVNSNPRYYREMFGTSYLSVEILYPSSTEKINVFNFTYGNEVTLFSFPMLISDERFVPEKLNFGWVNVGVSS